MFKYTGNNQFIADFSTKLINELDENVAELVVQAFELDPR